MSDKPNYRIIAFKSQDKVYFQIHEVQYENNIPTKYSQDPIIVGNSDLTKFKQEIALISQAITKPPLWGEDKFPHRVIVKYTCQHCFKNFQSKTPHQCKSGFRKKINWKVNYF